MLLWNGNRKSDCSTLRNVFLKFHYRFKKKNTVGYLPGLFRGLGHCGDTVTPFSFLTVEPVLWISTNASDLSSDSNRLSVVIVATDSCLLPAENTVSQCGIKNRDYIFQSCNLAPLKKDSDRKMVTNIFIYLFIIFLRLCAEITTDKFW